MQTKIVAEIGINHNGNITQAKQMIDVASVAGCDYVKFQKRTPEIAVPESQKNIPKETPWGSMSYLEYKKKIEFGKEEYDILAEYCKSRINMFASVWDIPSCDFMTQYSSIGKIPSALITDLKLCKYARGKFEILMISTGMSTEKEIETCITTCNPNIVFHTNSSYPSLENELNLKYIKHLKRKYPDKIIGYSGHEYGLVTTFAAVVLGAEYIERHICLNRFKNWGSDQKSSIEPSGFFKLVRGIRNIEDAMGSDADRVVYPGELEKRKTLRGK